MKINWSKLWRDFDEWYEKSQPQPCESCGHKDLSEKEWDDQQAYIQRLVSAQLRGK